MGWRNSQFSQLIEREYIQCIASATLAHISGLNLGGVLVGIEGGVVGFRSFRAAGLDGEYPILLYG